MDFDRRLEIAGALVIRSKVFFDAWWLSASVEGRAAHRPFWDEFWHFWRYNEHAFLVSFVIHTAGLFEARRDTVNLPAIWLEVRSEFTEPAQIEMDALFAEAAPIAKGVTILRSNVMAHRSASLEYNDAFRRAHLRPMDMRRLTELALAIVNDLRSAFGKLRLDFDEIAIGDLKAIASMVDTDEGRD